MWSVHKIYLKKSFLCKFPSHGINNVWHRWKIEEHCRAELVKLVIFHTIHNTQCSSISTLSRFCISRAGNYGQKRSMDEGRDTLSWWVGRNFSFAWQTKNVKKCENRKKTHGERMRKRNGKKESVSNFIYIFLEWLTNINFSFRRSPMLIPSTSFVHNCCCRSMTIFFTHFN